jgi:outer membrane receptor protein involved in Fe transport
MNELYRTGQVGQEITLANAALLSERATGWEVGTAFSAAGRVPATLRATYFWTEINRPVAAVLITQTATVITNQRQNLGQILSRGVELALQTNPARALSGNVGYQFADATVTKFSSQSTLVGNCEAPAAVWASSPSQPAPAARLSTTPPIASHWLASFRSMSPAAAAWAPISRFSSSRRT